AIGNMSASSDPSNAVTPPGAQQVSAGHYNSCAIVGGGGVRCWGIPPLGNGTTDRSFQPVAVTGLTGATALTAGIYHMCAIVTGGGVSCWGANNFGQLGTGTTGAQSTTPVTVTGLTGATAIAAGQDFTCVIVTGGAVKCWGRNNLGQL